MTRECQWEPNCGRPASAVVSHPEHMQGVPACDHHIVTRELGTQVMSWIGPLDWQTITEP